MTQKARKGLGRGLSSLLGEDKTAAQNTAAGKTLGSDGQQKLPIAFLKPNRWQPRYRFDDSAVEELADSLAEHGIIQPILVRKLGADDYEIIAGERRWRAAQKAGLHDVPVVIRDLTDEESLELAIIENIQRESLTAVEEAKGYKRLMDDFKHTQEKVSQMVGKSRSHVANLLRLLSLPSSVQDLVDEGDLSMGHARALIGHANAASLAKEIVKKGLNVRQTEALVKPTAGTGKSGSTLKAAAGTEKDADTRALERDLTDALGLAVEINHKGEAGQLIISYKTLEQLDDVLEKLNPSNY
mgnify:CR=1 FL=1